MPSDELVARRQALEEKRRRIEALKAQKAERARQAATSQKSAASAAANLRSYVDGLLSQKSEAPAPAAPVSTPNGTQLPPPPPPAAPRASTSPRYERKVVDVLAAATQTESHEDVDEAAAAQARLEAENSERALQNRSNSSSDSARKKTADIHKVEKKPVDLSSLSSRAKLVEKCLGERDVFDALFAPVSVETQESAGANFPSSGRTTFTMPVEAACTGVAIIRERPEAFVASYASSTSEFDGDVGEEGCVCVWSLASTKAPDSQFRCEAGITSIACDPRHPSLVLGGAASGQLLLFDGRTQTCVGRSPLDRHAPHSSSICALSVRDDGTVLTGSSDGVACLWAPGNLERPLEKRLLNCAVSCADFADDQSAYVGCEAGSVSMATFGGSEPCAALGAHRGRVTCLAAHPASRKGAAASSDTLGLRRHLLASASVDWTCRLRVGSTPLGAPLDHGAHGYVASIAWSPSRAALLCTAASDGCVRLWTAASGQIIGAAEQLSAGALTSVAFSGDGRRVVVGDALGCCTVAALEASVCGEHPAEAARLDELLGGLAPTD